MPFSSCVLSQKDRVERDTGGNKIVLDGIWVTLKGTRLAELPRNREGVRESVRLNPTPSNRIFLSLFH